MIFPKMRLCNNSECKLYGKRVSTHTIPKERNGQLQPIECCLACSTPVIFKEYPKEYIDSLSTMDKLHLKV